MESQAGETATADSETRKSPDQLARGWVWTEGEWPQECEAPYAVPPGGILWFDVEDLATPQEVLDLLGPVCPGLERAMVEDLLCRDDIPEGRSWDNGGVRLASSFAVYAPAARENGGLKPIFTPSAEAVYEAVELLAGKNWLITRWHHACLFRGAKLIEDGLRPVSRDDLLSAVSKRWIAGNGGSAGALGVLAMHELALTYAPTHRRFCAALEEWELALYGGEGEPRKVSDEDERRLRDLWGARARLRDWLNPLNVPGLRGDPNKAWLPTSDHKEVVAVDERIDDSLRELSKLGDTLRSSFQLLFIQKSEAQREHNERSQRRLEIIATIFLVPTIVVGFFGANTWVPGEHRHWGLTLMFGAMAVLTCIVMVFLWLTFRRGRAKPSAWGADRRAP